MCNAKFSTELCLPISEANIKTFQNITRIPGHCHLIIVEVAFLIIVGI